MQRTALYSSCAVFTLVALLHGLRAASGMEIIIGGYLVPVWWSAPAAIIAALLAAWTVVAARRS